MYGLVARFLRRGFGSYRAPLPTNGHRFTPSGGTVPPRSAHHHLISHQFAQARNIVDRSHSIPVPKLLASLPPPVHDSFQELMRQAGRYPYPIDTEADSVRRDLAQVASSGWQFGFPTRQAAAYGLSSILRPLVARHNCEMGCYLVYCPRTESYGVSNISVGDPGHIAIDDTALRNGLPVVGDMHLHPPASMIVMGRQGREEIIPSPSGVDSFRSNEPSVQDLKMTKASTLAAAERGFNYVSFISTPDEGDLAVTYDIHSRTFRRDVITPETLNRPDWPSGVAGHHLAPMTLPGTSRPLSREPDPERPLPSHPITTASPDPYWSEQASRWAGAQGPLPNSGLHHRAGP